MPKNFDAAAALPANLRPMCNAAAVTPSDDNDLAHWARGLYVGGAGNVAVITVGGDTVTLTAAAVGVIHNICVSRVKATGTTATNIVALY